MASDKFRDSSQICLSLSCESHWQLQQPPKGSRPRASPPVPPASAWHSAPCRFLSWRSTRLQKWQTSLLLNGAPGFPWEHWRTLMTARATARRLDSCRFQQAVRIGVCGSPVRPGRASRCATTAQMPQNPRATRRRRTMRKRNQSESQSRRLRRASGPSLWLTTRTGAARSRWEACSMCLPAEATGAATHTSARTAPTGASGFPAPLGSTFPLARAAMESPCPWGNLRVRTEAAVLVGVSGFPRCPGSTPQAAPAASKLRPQLFATLPV